MRRHSFFFHLFVVVAEELVPWPRMENARRRVRLVDCFPRRVHYDRARLSPAFPRRPFLSTAFLRLRQRRSCCRFPGGVDGNYGKSCEFSQNCDGNFIFRLRRSSNYSNSWKCRLRYTCEDVADIPSIEEH